MNPRELAIKKLSKGGYEMKRIGANHDILFSSETKKTIAEEDMILMKMISGTSSKT